MDRSPRELPARSLAWINSARKRSAEYHRLRMIGIDRYRTLSARYPDAAWLRFDGGLTWDADDRLERDPRMSLLMKRPRL